MSWSIYGMILWKRRSQRRSRWTPTILSNWSTRSRTRRSWPSSRRNSTNSWNKASFKSRRTKRNTNIIHTQMILRNICKNGITSFQIGRNPGRRSICKTCGDNAMPKLMVHLLLLIRCIQSTWKWPILEDICSTKTTNSWITTTCEERQSCHSY